MKTNKAITALIFFLFFVSCDRKSCETDNPIFLEHIYSDQLYKAELAKQIEFIGQENLRYWLHDYISENNTEYLLFYVQNESLCAEVLVNMEHWSGLEYIHKNKGKGSFNAEFRGLRFDIQKKDTSNIEFVYKSIERIID